MPCNVAANLGADVVVGVRLMHASDVRAEALSETPRGRSPSLFSMLLRSLELMQSRISAETAATATILITPLESSTEEIERIGLRRWRSARQYAPLGEAAVEVAALPRLAAALPWGCTLNALERPSPRWTRLREARTLARMAVEATAPARALDLDRPQTIVELWRHAATRAPERTAFFVDGGGRAGWSELSWREAAARVEELAAGFHALGIGRGDFVGILSNTRVEWTLCDYALLSLGAVVVPIYQTSSREDCAHVLTDPPARRPASARTGRSSTRSWSSSSRTLRLLVAIEDAAGDEQSLDAVGGARARGARPGACAAGGGAGGRVLRGEPAHLHLHLGHDRRPEGLHPDAPNWCCAGPTSIEQVVRADGSVTTSRSSSCRSRKTSARLVQFAAARIGFAVAFVPDVKRVARALENVRPTIFPSVPRLFGADPRHRRAGGSRQETGLSRACSSGGRSASAAGGRAAARPACWTALQLRLADRLVFGKIQERFGGHLRHAVSGGAPLALVEEGTL